MGWIQTIIESEYRKHSRLEWARIAEAKIITELKDRGLLKEEIILCPECQEQRKVCKACNHINVKIEGEDSLCERCGIDLNQEKVIGVIDNLNNKRVATLVKDKLCKCGHTKQAHMNLFNNPISCIDCDCEKFILQNNCLKSTSKQQSNDFTRENDSPKEKKGEEDEIKI